LSRNGLKKIAPTIFEAKLCPTYRAILI